MSELAGPYYQQRARRLSIKQVPDILNGQPVLLLGDDHEQRLSLQRPDPGRLKKVNERYARIIRSVNDFVIEGYQKTQGDYPAGTARRVEEVNKRHIDSTIEARLLPSYLKAGHVKDIQIEAIARSEVQERQLSQAGQSTGYYYDKDHEDSEVYLLLSGALIAGRPLGYTACLTLVAANFDVDKYGDLIVMPKYMGVAFRKNELLAKSGLWQSRATRNYIDMWGLTDPQLQNTSRSKRQRGSA